MLDKENKKSKKNNTQRVILNVPKEIDVEFKELAQKRGIAKSQMIIYAMSWYLENNRTMEMMPKIINLFSDEKMLKGVIVENMKQNDFGVFKNDK